MVNLSGLAPGFDPPAISKWVVCHVLSLSHWVLQHEGFHQTRPECCAGFVRCSMFYRPKTTSEPSTTQVLREPDAKCWLGRWFGVHPLVP